ncbi:MAG: PKD domain-containing protein [Bacteroidota bacterium]
MKKLLIGLYFLTMAFTSLGNHTKGGWLYYEYLGNGAASNTARYRITLKIYTECFLSANQWCPNVNISIFNGGSNSLVDVQSIYYSDSMNVQNCTSQECHPCINPIPNICYKIGTFTFIRELPITPDGYIISYQRCCRIANIINMVPGSSSVGDTWTVSIPGTNGPDPTAYTNSSAKFSQNDTAIICKDNFFTFDFSAIDNDGDSLSYAFTDAYYSSQGNNTGQCGSQSSNPPFSFISYTFPYSGKEPMGSNVKINPVTGIVSGIAPQEEGTYVVTCTITEYKRGTSIIRSSVQKSLHITVADCALTQALLDPEYFSCESFTRSFVNKAPGGNIQTYFWDFGVPGSSSDTSSSPNPTFTYPDTGTYVLKLVVNRSLPCPDSMLSVVKVYPVFAPAFNVQGQCKNTPIQFTDVSTTTYGTVDSWSWNFGDATAPDNISKDRNPSHIFATGAEYQVSCIVSNSKGCKDTLNRIILITDRPALEVTNDTLICVIDTLQLKATGFGTVVWKPNYNIDDLGAFSPSVSPDVPTRYFVTLTDPYGCAGTDSVFVDVKSSVSVRAGPDTTICGGDAVRLNLVSDALYFAWTESLTGTSLDLPATKSPMATPLSTTTYTVSASIGKCLATDAITLKAVPYPLADAGVDTIICSGNSLQLTATGGSNYNWTPATFLTNRSIPNPIANNPSFNITYTVLVRDTLGCPKAVLDSVRVTVATIVADAGPRDTSIVSEQPLQLVATGSSNYFWTPPVGLTNVHVFNPIASPQSDVTYIVKVSNNSGCFAYDSIHVRVFSILAGFHVPSAFSPNMDGRNDYFKPIAIGMKSVDQFRVFNRWGQLMYSNVDLEVGWDGRFKGNEQAPGTYVFYAEGTDFRNMKIKKRGYVVLLR